MKLLKLHFSKNKEVFYLNTDVVSHILTNHVNGGCLIRLSYGKTIGVTESVEEVKFKMEE